jgi:hypothetical protein
MAITLGDTQENKAYDRLLNRYAIKIFLHTLLGVLIIWVGRSFPFWWSHWGFAPSVLAGYAFVFYLSLLPSYRTSLDVAATIRLLADQRRPLLLRHIATINSIINPRQVS